MCTCKTFKTADLSVDHAAKTNTITCLDLSNNAWST